MECAFVHNLLSYSSSAHNALAALPVVLELTFFQECSGHQGSSYPIGVNPVPGDEGGVAHLAGILIHLTDSPPDTIRSISSKIIFALLILACPARFHPLSVAPGLFISLDSSLSASPLSLSWTACICNPHSRPLNIP